VEANNGTLLHSTPTEQAAEVQTCGGKYIDGSRRGLHLARGSLKGLPVVCWWDYESWYGSYFAKWQFCC